MQTLRFILFSFITLTIISNAQTIIPPGNVSGTWTLGGSPYEIQGEINIPLFETLTIEPGVLVEFQGHYKFIVEGRLLAVGTETDTITFTINDTTGFSIPDTSLGGWHGIRFNWTSPANDSSKIIYCKLQYGKAVGSSWGDRQGGAIFIIGFDKLLISNCLITNNSVGGVGYTNGGGISTNLCNLQVDNCTFIENKALDTLGSGGAIYCGADTTYSGFPYQVKITNSHFIDNSATSTAGVVIQNWGDDSLIINVIIDNCEFIDNASDNYTGLSIRGSSFTVSNSIFKGNTAIRFAAGAGFSRSVGTVWNCLFASNVASTGGGGWNSGGVSVWSWSNVDFMNCTFADNSASYGAGLTVGRGSDVTTTNCIFWGNSGDQIALDTYDNFGGTLTVNYCDVQGGEDSVNVIDPLLSTLIWGINNTDEDPLFVNSGNGDYHLQDTSTCINAAIDAIPIGGVWHYCPDTDIEGNPRPNPTGSMPDMGAYESPEGIVGIEENETGIPTEYALYQNYPNPFNPSTNIKYRVPETGAVKLSIYSVIGEQVAVLVDGIVQAGFYEVTFDAANLPSGIYFYRLQAGSFVETKKMVFMK